MLGVVDGMCINSTLARRVMECVAHFYVDCIWYKSAMYKR
jgi:hypothetical protein